MMRARRLWAASMALFAALSVLGEAPPFRFAREVKVATSGWNRVDVPLDLLRRVPPGTSGMELLDPDGRPVAIFPWQPPAPPPPRSHIVRLSELVTVSGGWQASADLGTDAPVHRRLVLDVPGRGMAEGVTLEGSQDGRTWRTLARGSLFRLSYSGDTERTCLEYPPTRDRRLRLFWPEAAGFPRWREVRVEDWPDAENPSARVREAVAVSPLPAPEGCSRWRMALPPIYAGEGRLELACNASNPVTVSLLAAVEGSWEVRAETVLSPGKPCSLPLPPGAYPGGPVLALDGGAFSPPPLVGVTLLREPRAFLFSAPQAGTYRLLYGSAGVVSPIPGRATLPDSPERLPEGELGPEVELTLPDLPTSSLAAGATLPRGGFRFRQALACAGAAPLRLVRLEVPAEVYGAARADLSDLRVGWNGKQVPFVIGEPAGGTPAAVLRGMTPAAGEEGRSVLEVGLPSPGLPLTHIELSAPPSPFTRAVTVQYFGRVQPQGGLPREEWVTVASAIWSCPGVSDLPARCRIPLGRIAGTRVRILFEDGDNAPLRGLGAILWRRRHEVVFPWPGEGQVDLLAGNDQIASPEYDLAALREELLTRTALTAAPIGRAEQEGPGSLTGSGLPGWLRSRGRWVLLGALGLAAALLLAILGRSVRRPDGGEKESGK